MIRQWDKDKGNYGKKIHKGVGFSIFNFQFSIFIAAASTAAIIIIVLSAPHCDVAAKSAGADLVCDWGDCRNTTTHTLFPSATAMDVTMPLQKACAAPNAQADLKLTGQLPAASFQHNPTADSERAGQPNDLTELRVATDGRKEVNPAACRGGNARVSGRRSADQKPEARSQKPEVKEKEIILQAARHNGLNADQTAILMAIRRAENGKAGREFGVLHPKAVDTNLRTQARWAAATVAANWKRFADTRTQELKNPRTQEFIHFLADRYCPPSVDPVGNRNWKKNVAKIVDCQL